MEEFLRGYFKNLEYLGELYFWRGCRILVKIQGWHNVYCRYRECCTKFIPKFADSGKYFYIVDKTLNLVDVQEVSFVLIWMLFKWKSKSYAWLAWFTMNTVITKSHIIYYSNLDSPLNVASNFQWISVSGTNQSIRPSHCFYEITLFIDGSKLLTKWKCKSFENCSLWSPS